MFLENSGDSGTTADRLLFLLKKRGPQTAAVLGELLGVTGEAARQQLVKLSAEGAVVATSEIRGVGRPTQEWKLTAAGNARFPDTHAELTAQLIRVVRTELGQEVLDRLIDVRAAESLADYRDGLAESSGLSERVAKLAELRSQEGYMAECRAEGNGFLLVENHCPICVAAMECQGFCRAELATFQAVLGDQAKVERIEHIVGGDRRCAYRITEKQGQSRKRKNK